MRAGALSERTRLMFMRRLLLNSLSCSPDSEAMGFLLQIRMSWLRALWTRAGAGAGWRQGAGAGSGCCPLAVETGCGWVPVLGCRVPGAGDRVRVLGAGCRCWVLSAGCVRGWLPVLGGVSWLCVCRVVAYQTSYC